MIDDGLFKRFPKPDVVLGQHVMVGSAGDLGWRAGVMTFAGDSLQIRLFGRGAHGSMPQASIDPVVMAAATVLRLQTIVAREVAAITRSRATPRATKLNTTRQMIARRPASPPWPRHPGAIIAAGRRRAVRALRSALEPGITACGNAKTPSMRQNIDGAQPNSTERIESEAMSNPSMGKRTASRGALAPAVYRSGR